MTDNEKIAMKTLSKLVCDSLYQLSVCRAVLKRHVPTWEEETAKANASPDFQNLRADYEHTLQRIYQLIDESDLSSVLSSFPTEDPVN